MRGLVLINPLCLPLSEPTSQLIPASLPGLYLGRQFTCQQTDTSLFTELESGLFFCFLETSLKSSIIFSLMKTVAPAERNSAYGPNTAYVVLFLKEIFFTPFNMFFNSAQWIRLPHSGATCSTEVVSFK